jgi:hypothetical protein
MGVTGRCGQETIVEVKLYSTSCRIALFVIAVLLLSGCASYEKKVNLIYEPTFLSTGGDGEVYVSRPVMEARLTKLPGGRGVLGAVQDSVTQIVTADDVSQWGWKRLSGGALPCRI